MKLKLVSLTQTFLRMHFASFLKLVLVAVLTSCIPTAPNGDDIEIETAETSDPELVNKPATSLQWGDESVESGVSYANKARAHWTPSDDAPFFSRQKIHVYSDPNCVVPIGSWRNVPTGKNEFWIEGLTHLATVSYRIKTYTDINEKDSPCSPPISVDLLTQKAPVITSTCTTVINQDDNYKCSVTARDLNLQTLTYSLSADTCGVGNLNMNATTGELTWDTDDDDFSTNSCSVNVVVTDTDTDTDSQALVFTLNNAVPTLNIADQSVLENSGAAVLLTNAEVQASDEGFGLYSITAQDCDPALGSLGGINTTTGELSFTPAANLHGACQITIQFDDQNSVNNTVSKTVNVTVVSTNQAPTIADDCATSKTELEAYSCQITATDGDASDTLTYSLSTDNTCAWAAVDGVSGAVNTIGAVPLTDVMVGPCTLGLQVTDGNDTTKSQKSVTINNAVPTLSIADMTSTGNPQPYSETEIKSDAQVQSSEEPYGTYTLVAPDNSPACSTDAVSLSIDAKDGSIDFMPQETFPEGSCFIKVQYTDTHAASVTNQFLLNWNRTNSSAEIIEEFTNSSCSPTGTQDSEYNCELRVNPYTNVDGDQIQWVIAAGNTCNWITSADFNTEKINSTPNDIDQLTITDTPTDDDVGTCTLAIQANDLELDGVTVKDNSTIFTRSITISNVVPTFNSITTEFSIDENAPETTLFTNEQMQVSDEGFGNYSLGPPDSGINCLDPDPGVAGIESGVFSLNASNGELKFTPASNYSDDCSFKIHFDDGNPGGTVETTISMDFIEQPDVPVISESCVRTMTEDDGSETNTYSCTIGLDDPDFEDTFTWTMVATNNNPPCNWLSFPDPTDNVLSGIPEDDDVGTCDVKIFVTDSYGNSSNPLEWTITINNQVPTILPDPAVDAGTGGEFLEDSGSILVKSDSDIQSLDEGYGVYSLDLDTVNPVGCHEYGILEVDPLTGAVRFQPAANWSGDCNVKLSFDDGNPTGNIDTTEFQVTITEVQDNPTLNLNHCPRTLLEDGSYYCEPYLDDTDVSDTVTLNVVSNSCPTLFRKDDGGGNFIEQIGTGPDDDDIGNCTIVLEAEDNTGNKSAQESLVISILNQPPIINLDVDVDNIFVYEDATNTTLPAASGGAIILQDSVVSSVDEGHGQYFLASPLRSPSCLDVFGSSNLTIDINNGEIVGIPPANYHGECFLRIQFNDQNNPNGVASRDIRVQILPVSDVPEITHDCATEATQETNYSCDFNFTDVETNEKHVFELAGDNTCNWIVINAVTGLAQGTPRNEDMTGGSCVLSVNIRDGRQGSPTNDKITITLNNLAPEFTLPLSDTSILEDADLTVIKRHELVSTTEEGQGGLYDVIASVGSPDCQSHTDTLDVDQNNGQISMKPSANFNGDCYINIEFADGNGETVSSEFKVNVVALSDSITITSNCPDTVAENSVYTCDGTLNDPDSASGITWNFASGHTCNWLTIGSVNGIMSATPTDDDVGTCVLSYQATDGIRTSEIKQETITITNIAPTFVAGGPFAVNENSANVIVADIGVNDNHEGYGNYSIQSTTASSPNCRDEAIVSINPITGEITYTPGNPANVDGNGKPIVTIGSCYLTVLFDDGNSAPVPAEFKFDIQEDNDPPVITEGTCSSNATEDTLYTCDITLDDEEIATISIDGGSPTHNFILHSTHTCGLQSAPGDFSMTTGAQSANSSVITYQFTPTNVQSNRVICTVAFTIEEDSTGVQSELYTKTLVVQNNPPTFTLPAAGITKAEQDGTYTVVSDAEIETDDEADENAAITAGVLADHYGTYSLLTVGANRCGTGSAQGITTIDSKTGAITFNPDEGSGEFNGTCNFYVSYDDGTDVQSTSQIKQIAFTVTAQADAPVITGDTCSNSATEGTNYTCTFSATDPDQGDSLIWSLAPTNTCFWLSVNPLTGAIEGTVTDSNINTLGGTCDLVVRVSDGTTNVDSTAKTLNLINLAPVISSATQFTVKTNSTDAEILGDLEISTVEELAGQTGGYSLFGAEIVGSGGAACDGSAAIHVKAGSPDPDTGAIIVTTDNNNGAKCRVTIRYTDANGAKSDQVITITNSSNTSAPTYRTISTACDPNPAAQLQNADFTHCDLSLLAVTPAPAAAIDLDTHFQIDPSTTCTVSPNSGTDDGVWRDGTTLRARFGNTDVGTCDFVYYLDFGAEGQTNRKKVVFTVNNVTPTFTGNNSPNTLNEDGGNQTVLSASDMQYDEENDVAESKHFYRITDAAGDDCQDHGVVTIDNRDGQVNFNPDQDYNGNCDIDVEFNDGNGGTASLTLANVAVTAAADGPDIAGAETNNQSCLTSLQEGNAYSCLILHNDPDTGDDIVWSKVTTGGTPHTCGAWLTLAEEGGTQNLILSGTPDNAAVGTCTVYINVTDGSNSDRTRFDLTIANASPEILITQIEPVTEDGGPTVVVQGANIDISEGNEADGSYALDSTQAQNPKCSDNGTLIIDAATGEITYDPAKDFDDICSVYVTFDDGNSAEPSGRTFFVRVTPVNDTPTISTSCNREIEEGDDFVCYLRGINPEEEQELSWSINQDCGWLNLHSSGVLYGKPTQNDIDTCEAEVEISDQLLSSTTQINIIVRNKAPQLTLVDKNVIYSSSLTTYLLDKEVEVREEGEAGTSYNLASDRAGANGCFHIANIMTIDSATGSVQMQIDPDKRPSHCDVGIEFFDGEETVYDQMRLYLLDDLNDLPVVTSDCVVTIEEDSQYICYPKATTPDLTNTTWSLHPSNSCDWLSINGESGFIQGKPNNSDVGECTLAFYASSNTGRSPLVYYDISVTNKAPTFALPNSGTRKIRAGSTGIELFSDSDVQALGEGNGFYFINPSLSNSNDCRYNSRVILDNNSGSLVLIPNQFFGGDCSLDIGYYDLNGTSSTSTDLANINISGSNSAPRIVATCAVAGAVGEIYNCVLTGQDLDGDDIQFELANNSEPDSCSSWLTLTAGTGEDEGTATLSGTPSNSNIGTCKVIAYARDSADTSIQSNRYEFEINVPNVAGSFAGTVTTVTIDEDAPFETIFSDADIVHSKEGVLNTRNMTGKYFLAAASPSATQLDCRSQGKLQINPENGEVKYSPYPNNTTNCQIKLGFDDLEANDNIQYQTLFVNINATDDIPSITSTCIDTIEQNQSYACFFTHDDIDSATSATWAETERDTCTWMTISSTGTLTGVPANDNVGKCFLSVTVTNDGLTSLPYEQYINVTGFVSSFALGDKILNEDSTNTIIYSNNEVNAQEEGLGNYYLSDNLINNQVSCSDYGVLTINSGSGEVRFTPNPDQTGTCYIRIGFQENNAQGNRFETQGMLTILPVNDPPELEYNCGNLIDQGQEFSCQPIFYDKDGDGPDSYQLLSNSCSWLQLNLSDGTLVGTPSDENIQACSVRVISSDGTLNSNEVTLNLEVINAPPYLTIRDTHINKNSGFVVLRSDQDVQATEEGFGEYNLIATANQPSCDSNGSLAIDTNVGEITFAPNLNFVGICFVNISFDDGNGGLATSEFKVTVNDLNEKPTISESCSHTATEGTAYSCTVNLNDDNYPGFVHTWFMEEDYVNTCDFLSINPTTGVITGTPDNRHVGTCRAAFYVSDGVFDSNVKSIQITVSNINPTLTIGNQTTTENNTSPGTTKTIDANALGESSTVGLYSFMATSQNPDCRTKGRTSIGLRDGVINFEPEVDFQGDCYLKVKFDDENGGVTDEQFSITVTNDPDNPIITTDCTSAVMEQDNFYTCNVYVTELDGESLSAINATGCTWVQTDPATGVITINPSDDDVGTCTLTLEAIDTNGDASNELTDIVLTVTNKMPGIPFVAGTVYESDSPQVVLTDSQIQSTEEGMGNYSLAPLSTTGLDCDDIGDLSIDGSTGAVTFTPDNFNWTGTCYVEVVFDDGNAKANSVVSVPMTVNIININDDPDIDFSNCDTTINEGSLYNCVPTKVEDADLAYSFDSLTFTAGANHTCNWLTISTESGLLFGDPDDTEVGTCTAHIVATDSTASSDEEQFDITVANVAPTLNIANAIIDEGTSTNTVIRTDKDVESRNEGNGTYSVESASVDDCQNIGPVTVSAGNGQVSFDPDTPITADCNIRILFTDTNDTNNTSFSEFTVFVQAVDDPPVLTANCDALVTQDDDYNCNQQPSATDDSSGNLIYLTGANHTCYWVNLDTLTGEVTGTPNNTHIGECTLEIQAYDGIFFSNAYNRNVSVLNRPPTLDIPALLLLTEDFPGVNRPLSDTDVEASEEGAGTYSIDENTAGSPSCTEVAIGGVNGVTIEPNGAVTFNAPEHFEGSCFIKVVFDDGNQNNNIASDEVQLLVEGENDDPTISLADCETAPTQSDSYECNITVNEPDLGDSLTFSFGDTHTCDWAILSPNSGKVTADLTNADVGPCVLSIKVQDVAGITSGEFNEGTVSINVANETPTLTIADVFLAAGSGNVEILSDEQVQANEEGSGTYLFDDPGITGTKCSDNATSISIDASTGAVMMDIENSFTGTCNIKIDFNDGNGQLVAETVNVTVTNDANLIAPQIANNSTLEINQSEVGVSLQNHLDVHDFDDAPTNVVFTLNRVPKYGELKLNTSVLNQNGTFTLNDLQAGNVTYNHGDFFSSADSFNFSVSDGTSTISGQTFNIKILDVRVAENINSDVIFANNGDSYSDLSSNNKSFFENGYTGDRPAIGQTTNPIHGGYISFPTTSSNFNLKVQNLFADNTGFSTNGFSIQFYMKSETTVDAMIMATQGYEFNALGEFGWGLKVLGGGALYFKANGTGDPVEMTSTDVVNDNRWHAITIARIGSDLKMYIDGIEQGTPAGVSTVNFDSEVDLIIGAEHEADWEVDLPNALTAIDEIRIYKDVVPGRYNNNHFALTCPSNFIMVPSSLNSIHLNPFCAAKYEMKEANITTPISQATGLPWSDVTQSDARTFCSNMGSGFSLINNDQWMSMANNIETVASNWSNGVFTSMATTTQLSRGNFESFQEFAASEDDSDFCANVAGCSSAGAWHEKKRTFTLTNGEVIWDLSGNAIEHVDAVISSDKPGPISTMDPDYDVNDAAPTTSLSSQEYQPYTSTSLTTEDHAIGTYFPGDNGSGGVMLRGGNSQDDSGNPLAGLYSLDISNASSQQAGFRCIFLVE